MVGSRAEHPGRVPVVSGYHNPGGEPLLLLRSLEEPEEDSGTPVFPIECILCAVVSGGCVAGVAGRDTCCCLLHH